MSENEKSVRINVKIMPRNEILDTQGRAVLETLRRQGQELKNCRVGKMVELEFSDISMDEAKKRATTIAKAVLHNPLIETFEIMQREDR